MTINGVAFNQDELVSKDELIIYLQTEGENYRVLRKIGDKYLERFANELIWHYPISDGKHLGIFIVVVKEGFLSLPYDLVDHDSDELFELDDAKLFDAVSMQIFIDDWKSFSDDLVSAMTDMTAIMRENT